MPAAKRKTKVPAKKKAYTSELSEDSFDESSGAGAVGLYGEFGAGKTTAICSASEQWPFEPGQPLKRLPRKLVLEDVGITGWDRKTINGILALNIRPCHFLDMMTLAAKHDWDIIDSMAESTEEMLEICDKDKAVTAWGHDTITSLGTLLEAHWLHPKNIPTTLGGEENTQRAWNHIRNAHLEYHKAAFEVPGRVDPIFTFHPKAIELFSQTKNADQRKVFEAKKKLRQGGDSTVSVTLDLAGSGYRYYMANADLILVVEDRRIRRGSKTTHEHVFHLENTIDGKQTKNRFRHLFNAEEPAHLGTMLAKIRKALK